MRWWWLTAVVAGCASGPSPRWQQGGAATAIATAYWSRPSSTVELRPDGKVFDDDELLFHVDRKGRVSDAEGHPVAVLLDDGSLVTDRDGALGWIGAGTAYGVDRRAPTVRLSPTGQVMVAGREGAFTDGGRWQDCDGPMLRTCTLVTHVVAARDRAAPHDSPLQLLELLKLGSR
jgi:hypothetical protein